MKNWAGKEKQFKRNTCPTQTLFFSSTQQISAVLELSVRESIRAYGGCLGFKKAMKDAVWRRYASGRCQATFDPKMSEWGNPAEEDSVTSGVSQGSVPREVKHLSTWRRRDQYGIS